MASVNKLSSVFSKLNFHTVKVNNCDVKIFDKIHLKNSLSDDIFMFVNHEGDEHFNIFLESEKLCNLGREQISIAPPYDRIWGTYIGVTQKFRSNKSPNGITEGSKLGEAMRLGSIIEMIENNMKSIDINSMPQAVFFHTKYGFVPKTSASYDCVMSILNDIASNSNKKLRECSQKARDFIKIVESRKNKICVPEKIAKETDKTAKEYIDTIIRENLSVKDNNFTEDLGMRLSSDTIKKNKKFYNNLFEKHGIDYKIV